MKKPTLFVCRRCEGGWALFKAIKAERKARGLKPLFKVEDVKCLNRCDSPCSLVFRGKHRSTYVRVEVKPGEVERVISAAVAYAELEPGEELPERALPGKEE